MARPGAIVAVVAFVAVGAAALYWGPDLYSKYGDEVLAQETCTASLSGVAYSFTPQQADNAALIASVGRQLGFGSNGVTVAIATAIQESGLRNLDYGDRDSVGLFQQRPSQGWGTVEQILDRHYSATKFYDGLAKVDGWESLPVTEAAQAVQRSGFPDAYADHESEARALAEAFAGDGLGALECSLNAHTGTAQGLAERLAADHGQSTFAIDVIEVSGDTTVIGVRPAADSPQSRASLLAWLAATASATGVMEATDSGIGWSVHEGALSGTPEPYWAEYPGVRVVLATAPAA